MDHQLHVAITTDKPQYLPGQTANYSLSVTDDNGRPAPRAEFSLGVVLNEAIYAIRKDTTQDETFSASFTRASGTASSQVTRSITISTVKRASGTCVWRSCVRNRASRN